jgi:hypothetical protein
MRRVAGIAKDMDSNFPVIFAAFLIVHEPVSITASVIIFCKTSILSCGM